MNAENAITENTAAPALPSIQLDDQFTAAMSEFSSRAAAAEREDEDEDEAAYYAAQQAELRAWDAVVAIVDARTARLLSQQRRAARQ